LAKKKKVVKPQRQMTRRQLSRWQRQKRLQRLFIGLFIVIVVAICAIVFTGWYTNEYRPLHEDVIRVNNVRFTMDYFVKALKFYGTSAYNVTQRVQENELVRQEAMTPTIGITISDDEVTEYINSLESPLDNEYRDFYSANLLRERLFDEYIDPQVPTAAEQRHVMAMFLESESQAVDVRSRLEAGEDFTTLAGELSCEGLTKANSGDLDWHTRDIFDMFTEAMETDIPIEYAFTAEAGSLSEPLYDAELEKDTGYWLIKVLREENSKGMIYAQAILLGSEEEALEVRDRWESGEEDFDELADEVSQYDWVKEGRGELGWLERGTVTDAFDAYAFDPETELDVISQPIMGTSSTWPTTGGYWLVKVVDVDDNRTISDDDRSILKYQVWQDWVQSLLNDPDNIIESYLDNDKINWALEYAGRS
jgi:parvulin-like peptidyl-prolyl isomerase